MKAGDRAQSQCSGHNQHTSDGWFGLTAVTSLVPLAYHQLLLLLLLLLPLLTYCYPSMITLRLAAPHLPCHLLLLSLAIISDCALPNAFWLLLLLLGLAAVTLDKRLASKIVRALEREREEKRGTDCETVMSPKLAAPAPHLPIKERLRFDWLFSEPES